MNDTFDYFEVSQIDNFVKENLLKANESRTIKNISENSKSSISFDDSVFLESCISGICLSLENNKFPQNDENISSQKKAKSFKTSSIFADEGEDNELEVFCKEPVHVSGLQLVEEDGLKLDSEMLQSHRTLQESSQSLPNIPIPTSNVSCTSVNMTKKKESLFMDADYHLLSSWGLPKLVLNSYEKRNITSMFDWQIECLKMNGIVEENKNLVYSAPTSAGKTLVAEILAMKCLFERNKKVLFILPFISVVREKMYYFQDIFGSSGKRVEGFMGSYNPPGGFTPVHMAVGTIEKCNSLVNRLLQERKLEDLGLVVIDEMHLIGDPYRGYLLELLLTKLKYVVSKNSSIKIQIVGMSATLPNLNLLADWLNAELYTTDFRPIPLHEMVYVNRELYNNEFKLLRRLSTLPGLAADTDDILQLSLETIGSSCSVLIFCPTKNWCENLAQQIAMAFWRIGKCDSELSKILRNNLDIEKITEILEQLKYCPSGLDKILKNTIAFGVAFHHAGLTMEERDIIEGGFRNGGIKLLIATSTLSSGVNLPARRVIIRSPLFNGRPIDILTYRQMIGRAGRMGIDSEGQSILICQKSDHNVAKALTQSSLKPVQSCLEDIGKFKRAILEIIASEVASSTDDLDAFEKCTLIYVQRPSSLEEKTPITQVVEFLKNFHFIRLQTLEDGSSKFIPTALGKACLTSSLPPGEGLELFTELEKARQCFVLESELHLIYLVTPYSACYQWSSIDWMFYLELWEKLPLTMKKVGELVGVRESLIINATRGKVPDSSKLLIHKRFFIALALQELVNEKPLDEVSAKFSCNRGMLQSLQQSASTFAGMVTSFCKQLGWSSVEILISQFQERLQFGVNRDLLNLLRLPCLNTKQARALYNSGIETLIELANSDVSTIENILHKVVPFENISEREGESNHDFQQRNKLRTVWITGKQGLTEKEAAAFILHDVREYLENEMGVKNIKWGCQEEEGNAKTKESCLSYSKDEQSSTLINNCPKIEKQKYSQNSKFAVDLVTKKNDIVFESTSLNVHISIENKENLVTLSNVSTHSHNRKQGLVNEIRNYNILKMSQTNNYLQKSKNFTKESYKSEIDSGIEELPKQTHSKKDEISSSSYSEDDLFHESLEETISKVSSLTVGNKRMTQSNDSPYLKKLKIVHSGDEIEENIKKNSDLTFFKDRTTMSIDLSKFSIIEVCKYKKLFHSFCEELSTKTDIFISLACSTIEENTHRIGMNARTCDRKKYRYHFQNTKVDGIAFTWDGKNVFYLYLEEYGCDQKTEFLGNFFEKKQINVNMFDSKECVILLHRALGVNVSTQIEDPKILDWLLEPDGKEKNIELMISKYCPEAKGLLSLLENGSTLKSRMGAAVEVMTTWALMTVMKKEILLGYPKNVLCNFEIEMATIICVSKMEVAGIGIDFAIMESLISSIKSNVSAIEKKIYSLAGRKFSLTSSKEVAKVIGLRTSRRISTKKQVLEQSVHPISDLILLWRKLSCILCKMLLPLLSEVRNNRIYGKSITHTSTGRISMCEPNIQNIAKDFEFINPFTNGKELISCRSIFIPRGGCIFLSADYCQLELRMLANLSGDELLCNILKSEGDIFKTIAAKWNRISEDLVTDILRSQTKQICYGIIYGIGSKALAKQLKVEIDDAAMFMENFKNTYPGIKIYIQNVISKCKNDGYIETLSGRRRHLPHIQDENSAIRSHAERQAVNSTVQGSAADLVKRAMKKIDENIDSHFKESEKPTLVLHLHDELLFEIHEQHLQKSAQIIKESMESSLNFNVPFPVKLKKGNSWGSLVELCDIY